MTKLEFISRYGEDAYEHHKQLQKNWNKEHKEQLKQLKRNWQKEHKEQINVASRIYRKNSRQKGSTRFCRVNFDLIENYDLAKADNFDPKKWHLHHRLENYWSSATLIRKGLYLNVNPEALIWLPADEHHSDKSISTIHPELTKWHQRILENG